MAIKNQISNSLKTMDWESSYESELSQSTPRQLNFKHDMTDTILI